MAQRICRRYWGIPTLRGEVLTRISNTRREGVTIEIPAVPLIWHSDQPEPMWVRVPPDGWTVVEQVEGSVPGFLTLLKHTFPILAEEGRIRIRSYPMRELGWSSS